MTKTKKAFTVIELLLGLAMFSVIALSLYGAFAAGMQIEHRAQRDHQPYREGYWALTIMTDDIEQMVPYDFSASYPGRTVFSGTSDSLSFIRPGKDGLVVIRYDLQLPDTHSVYTTIVERRRRARDTIMAHYEEKTEYRLLVRRTIPFVDSLSDTQSASAEVDVMHPRVAVDGIRFYYAHVEGEGEEARLVWKDAWAEEYLPSGMRIELTLLPSGGLKEPVAIRKDIFIPIGFLGRDGSR